MGTVKGYYLRGMRFLILAVVMMGLLAVAGPVAYAGASDADARISVGGVRAGDTVNLYRIAALDEESGAYEFADDFGIDISEFIGAADDGDRLRGFVDRIAARVHGSGRAPDATLVADADGASFDGLDAGQYLVSVVPASPGCGVVYQNTTVNAADEEGSIVLKSQPITISKTVDGGHESDGYAVGQRAPFELATHVPIYPAEATHRVFRIVDTSSAGISFGAADVTVVCGGQTLAQGEYYTYSESQTQTGDTEHVLEFDYARMVPFAGQALTVGISALVTGEALPGADIPNTATVFYRNNPYVDGSDDFESDEARLRVYGVFLKKVDASAGEPLAGAEFEVLAADEAGPDALAVDGADVKVRSVASMVTGKNGVGWLRGISRGTYYIRETAAPDGYAKIDGIVRVDVTSGTVEKTGEWAGYADAGTIENAKSQPTPPGGTTPGGGGSRTTGGDKVSTSTPKTGDEAPVGIIVLVAAAAAAAVAAAVVMRRRRG